MGKLGGDPATLFRSLRPDDAGLQARAVEAAREAEQRWPLFKAVSPRKPEPTPALSAQERQHWSARERPVIQEHRPALSLPDVGNKLANSLNKMAGRTAQLAAAKPSARAEREQFLGETAHSVANVSNEPSPEKRRSLFSRAPTVEPEDAVPVRRSGLFGYKSVQPVAAEEEMPVSARSGDSLTNIFNRLEGKEKIDDKPIVKRPSFLGRLGKR